MSSRPQRWELRVEPRSADLEQLDGVRDAAQSVRSERGEAQLDGTAR
jgi:hypothetical protein